MIVAVVTISIAKMHQPVGHKLYGKFHHDVVLAKDKGMK